MPRGITPCSIFGRPFGMFCYNSQLLKLSYVSNKVKMELPILFLFAETAKYSQDLMKEPNLVFQ